MKKELKDRWVAALRSGEYKQTTKNLRDDNGFCCLGVLAHILDPNAWMPRNVGTDDKYYDTADEICDAVYQGIENDYGINFGVNVEELWMRNDGKNRFQDMQHDFNQMADYIEENVVED